MKKLNNKWKYGILVVFFLVLANLEFLVRKDLIYGHDIYFHLARIKGISDSIKAGTIPALIYHGYLSGYGYPNGVFYADIFLYLPALLVYLGLNINIAYKIMMILINIGIFGSMYYAMKKIAKDKYTALIVGLMYLMSSYKYCDMFLRAALGETLAFVFFPLFILGLYSIFYGDKKNWYYFTIGLIGICFSHNLSLLMCLMVTILVFFLNIKEVFKDKERFRKLMTGGILAILICLSFIGPMVEMMLSDKFSYSTLLGSDMVVKRAANPLYAIIAIPSGASPWQPMGIGLIFIFLLVYLRKVMIKDRKDNKFSRDMLFLGLVFLILSTSIFPWNLVKNVLGIIQFPWRFYMLVTILLLVGFGIKISNYKNLNKRVFTIVVSAFMIETFLIGSVYHLRFNELDDNKEYWISQGEYVPVDVDLEYLKTRGDIIASNEDVKTTFERKGINLEISYNDNNSDNTYLELPLVYYKGYVAKEDNNTLEVIKGDNGLVRVYLNNSEGNIKIYYGFTKVRIVCLIISVIALGGFIIIIKNQKKNYLI